MYQAKRPSVIRQERTNALKDAVVMVMLAVVGYVLLVIVTV